MSAQQSTGLARYSIREVCAITGLSRSAVYGRIAEGRLQPVKDGRRVFVPHEELARYLAACRPAR